jgi:formate/nitrite transporter
MTRELEHATTRDRREKAAPAEIPNPTGIDAYRPAEIAALVRGAGVVKARLPTVRMATLAVLAGAFIGLGATAYLMAMTGADPAHGPTRLLGGLVFSLGLILCIVGGAELFTGNALMVMAAVDRLIKPAEIARSWTIVYAGNLAGAAGLALLVWFTGLTTGPFGGTAGAIAEAKAGLGPVEVLARGIVCNMLVCLAVWLTIAARDVAGKILAILPPISAFVLLGMEHSVANMFFFPLGALAGASVTLADAVWNLVLVTIGNIVGGSGGVALAYRLAYGPRPV